MKKYTSVLMLHIRSTIYKILPVFLVMGSIEFLLFYRILERLSNPVYREDKYYQGFSYYVTASRIPFLFLAAFLLITLILTLHGFEFKEKNSYTLRRLRISEKKIFFLQGIFGTLIYFLLFAVQIFLIFLFAGLYFHIASADTYSAQTLFLSFYKNDFLHSLLPLEETFRVFRNLWGILALGFSSAYQSYCQRRGKKSFLIIPVAFIGILTFQTSLGSQYGEYTMIAVSLIALFRIGYQITRKGDGYEI